MRINLWFHIALAAGFFGVEQGRGATKNTGSNQKA